MKARSLTSEIILLVALIGGVCFSLFYVLLWSGMYQDQIVQAKKKFILEVKLAVPALRNVIAEGGDVQKAVTSIGALLESPVTLFNPKGEMLADSMQVFNHSLGLSRQVQQGLQGEIMISQVVGLQGQETLVAVVPVLIEGLGGFVLRVESPLDGQVHLNSPLSGEKYPLLFFIVVVGLVGLYWRLNIVLNPLNQLAKGIESLQKGNFEFRLESTGAAEFQHLSHAYNEGVQHLRLQQQDYNGRLQEEDAIFQGIGEGLLLLSLQGGVLRMNPASIFLLGIHKPWQPGVGLGEVTRNHSLMNLVQELAEKRQPVERQIELFQSQRDVAVHGSVLTDANNQATGLLIVMHDITELLRLEQVRKEFVSNVSHELKTPLTAIRGFSETLLDDSLEKADVSRFAKIIFNHVGRMSELVGDLLQLARLEEDGFVQSIQLQQENVAGIFQVVMESCTAKAQAAEIEIKVSVPEGLAMKVDARILLQALINLVENAVKYSRANTTVTLQAEESQKEIILTVEDQGEGIPLQHQSRIFERFYRVDDSRHRKTGGTGLGLSIVKRVVHLHQGKVELKSQVGVGSKFAIYLPK